MRRLPCCLLALISVASSTLAAAPPFAYGADISWLSEMEDRGVTFKDTTGKVDSLFSVLKQQGVNAIRLRVWVNPPAGYCNKQDVAAMAKRVAANGMRLMVDFHYSDGWADPSQQNKPAAWSTYTQPQLGSAVYNHTYAVLDTLKSLGITPNWVQVGNETSGGMLWPTATNHAGGLLYDRTTGGGMLKANGAEAFAKLIDSGYRAVKKIDTSIKVIVHINAGWNNALYKWVFDSLQTYHAHYDMIGMSFYPSVKKWRDTTALCLANMQSVVSRYAKPVVISEIGMPYDQPDSAYAMLKQMLTNVHSLATGYGIGIFYWEPEAHGGWNGYSLGAFDPSGKPTKALHAFAENHSTGMAPRTEQTESSSSLRSQNGALRLADGAGMQHYVLSAVSGKIMERGQVPSGSLVGSQLPAGLYLVEITGAAKSFSGRWLKP